MRAAASLVLAGSLVAACRQTPSPAQVPAPAPVARPDTPTFPVFAALPEASFTDQDGSPFTRDRLKQHVWIANFIFTTCAMACPILTARMGSIQTKLKDDPGTIQLLSFSILPDTDTPPVLKEYGSRFRQDPARWTFVTGQIDPVLNPVGEGFTTAASKDKSLLVTGESNFTSQHGELFVLIDSRGQVRGYYRKDDASLERLIRDARALAALPDQA